jgi:hypothetical protein
MGGHLLHHWNLPEKRVSRADFDRIIVEVLGKLRNAFDLRRIEPLKFFADKQDFGDLDVAFESVPGCSINWNEEIQRLFGYKPHKNGNCISFPVEGFQVDILLFGSEVFDIAQVYYAYESGNFMGRVADQMGLSYGHRGLYLQVPLSYFNDSYPEHEYREILVHRAPQVIFNILGFDYQRFQKGFKNFDEMSQWVADSRYFNPKVFAFDALNSINRTRNRKRPVYAAFVEWCAKQPANDDMPSKEAVRAAVIDVYRHVWVAVEAVREEIVLNQERREKFNGYLVEELRHIEGADLGRFIAAFKKSKGDFNAYLDARSAAEVRKDIIEYK